MGQELIDTDEVCEGCGLTEVTQFDIEGVPFCQGCWDDLGLWG